MNGRIRIHLTTSRRAGGCNFCDRWMTANGEIDHAVYEVKSTRNGSIVVRFCEHCAKTFRIRSR